MRSTTVDVRTACSRPTDAHSDKGHTPTAIKCIHQLTQAVHHASLYTALAIKATSRHRLYFFTQWHTCAAQQIIHPPLYTLSALYNDSCSDDNAGDDDDDDTL